MSKATEAEKIAREIPTCAVTGHVSGHPDACGDCDPCGAAHSVSPAVRRLIGEINEWRDKYEQLAVQRDAEAEKLALGLAAAINKLAGSFNYPSRIADIEILITSALISAEQRGRDSMCQAKASTGGDASDAAGAATSSCRRDEAERIAEAIVLRNDATEHSNLSRDIASFLVAADVRGEQRGAQREREDWLNIESAPTGTWVLVELDSDDLPDVARKVEAWDDDFGWEWRSANGGRLPTPTHWRPLPPPPVSDIQIKKGEGAE